jgi:hypothetical protein
MDFTWRVKQYNLANQQLIDDVLSSHKIEGKMELFCTDGLFYS